MRLKEQYDVINHIQCFINCSLKGSVYSLSIKIMIALNRYFHSPLKHKFRQRLSNQTIQPNRFLWHVRMQDENTDWLIAKNGLICPANYAVFAHNRLASFDAMFPYFLDTWDFHSDMFLVEGYQFTAYSFWRIDTLKAGVDWYVDPNMKTDAEILGFNPYNYVCSIQSIPNHALKLFTFDRARYVNMSPTLMVGDGVVSIKAYRSDFEALKPVRNINHYLAKKIKHAV